MAFIDVVYPGLSGIRSTAIKYWIPPLMGFGEARVSSGYLVDGAAPAGSSVEFSSGAAGVFVPDALVNSATPAAPPAISYSFYKGPTVNGRSSLESLSSPVSIVNRAYRYGPLLRIANNNLNTSRSCFEKLTEHPVSAWGGLLSYLSPGQTAYTDAARSSFIAFFPTASLNVQVVVVRVDTDISSGLKVSFATSESEASGGQITANEAIIGTRGSSLARIRCSFPAALSSVALHRWKTITGWELGASDPTVWELKAPVFYSDRPCADFAFDVDFPSPIGNQRLVYTCETRLHRKGSNRSSGTHPYSCIPVLTRRTTTTAPAAGYARTGKTLPSGVGYVIDVDQLNPFGLLSAQWGEDGGATGYRNVTLVRGRWDSDPNFNIRQWRPIPSFYELDQSTACDIDLAGSGTSTEYEIAWGYRDMQSGWVPVSTPITGTIVSGVSSVTLPVCPSIPSIPGMRYQILSRAKISPAAAFSSWSILCSSYNYGVPSLIMNYLNLAICLPRVYRHDVRLQALLPTSADSAPTAHYGYSFGAQVMLPDVAPTIPNTWAAAYVAANPYYPWQVTAVANSISGNASYSSNWYFMLGYKYRVSLLDWDTNRPYKSYTHLQTNASTSGQSWFKPSPLVTSTRFDIWRSAIANVGCGEDAMDEDNHSDYDMATVVTTIQWSLAVTA